MQAFQAAPDSALARESAKDVLAVVDAVNWSTSGTVVAAFAAIAAVIVAVWQLKVQRDHARQQTAFEHLRRISEYVRNIVRWDPIQSLQREVLQFYGGGSASLSVEASDYMALLTELDLLAYAADIGAADEDVVAQYTRTMYHEGVVSAQFLHEFHVCCGEDDSYQFLLARLEETKNLVQGGNE